MTPLAAIAAETEGPPSAAEFAAMETELRRFVRERLRPAEPRLADEDTVPPELLDEMRAMGLFATSLPRRTRPSALAGVISVSSSRDCQLER